MGASKAVPRKPVPRLSIVNTMKPSLHEHDNGIALVRVETGGFQHSVVQRLAVLGPQGSELCQRAVRDVGVIRVRLIETVFLDEVDAGPVRTMQAQLWRRTGAVETVDIELAAIGEVGLMPACILAYAARLSVPGQRNFVDIAFHGAGERTGYEKSVAFFVYVQQRRTCACPVNDVPVARGKLPQQAAVVVIQVEVGVPAAFGTPDELRS
jgi:hypothetical protein